MNSKQLQPPLVCDACQSANIVYIKETEVFGSSKRLWPFVWYCRSCRASVGCHAGTGNPLGYMANPYVRRLRAELHEIVDPIWHAGIATRSEIYKWIAKELELDTCDLHISELTITQLRLAIERCNKYAELNGKRIKKGDLQRQQAEASNDFPGTRHRKEQFQSGNGSRQRRNRGTDRRRY